MDPVFFVVLLLALVIAAIVFSRLKPYYRRRSQELDPIVGHTALPFTDASTSQHVQQQHVTPHHHETSSANSDMLTSQWTRQWVEGLAHLGTPWLSTMDEPEAVLAKLGWKATAIQPGEEQANYGRWPYPSLPRTVPNMPRSWFVTAQKQ